jgi:hypothetical protein
MGVGMPQGILLEQFGEHVRAAFGHVCYHVGSSLTEKRGWRDVDVRLILPDAEYAAMGLGDPRHQQRNKKWVSIILAWSAFGRDLTGLPIDFQIQQQSYANETENGPRSALFLVCAMDWSRFEAAEKAKDGSGA